MLLHGSSGAKNTKPPGPRERAGVLWGNPNNSNARQSVPKRRHRPQGAARALLKFTVNTPSFADTVVEAEAHV